jgi:hypothetical protein
LNAVTATVNTNLAALTATVVALAGLPASVAALAGTVAALAGLPASVAALTTSMASVEAKTHNLRCYARNKVAFVSYTDANLYAPVKTTPGVGAGLPAVVAAPLAAPPALADFTAPAAHFPATVNAFRRLKAKHVNRLSIEYNDDFGVVATDDEETIKKIFEKWLKGR